MSSTPQEDSDDDNMAQYVDNKHDSDGIGAQEHNARAGEGPVDIDKYDGDGKSKYGFSNTGENDEESWSVSSIADLDLELQKIQGFASEMFYFIWHDWTLKFWKLEHDAWCMMPSWKSVDMCRRQLIQ